MGTVRKGYRSGEVETFCRFVSRNGLVPFPVRECTDYADRRMPGESAEEAATFSSLHRGGRSFSRSELLS
jgi:hypothetical protein